MTDRTVLVVDDHPTNLKLVSVLLRSHGHDVKTATSAEEAIDAIAADPPRLILMDIQLPGTDGLTLTRRLKADEATRDIVVIAVTAYAMRGDEERALAAGCDGYVTKPIDVETLPAMVASWLERAAGRAAGRAAPEERP